MRRAVDLEVITERQYKYLYKQIYARGWRTQEPVQIEAERPRLFRKMLEKIYGLEGQPEILAASTRSPVGLVGQIIGCYSRRNEASAKLEGRTNVIEFSAKK